MWEESLQSEADFWQQWFLTKGLQYPEEYARRLDPERPLREELAALIPKAGRARILDVGAGPLTMLGKKAAGVDVEIVPVDALARLYDALMDSVGVNPLVRTLQCDAEDLHKLFGEAEFDLAHSQNALDHCYDPVCAIGQMLRVVKTGAYVYLRHNRNEAENERYQGLHQWNFDLRDGRFVIWNRSSMIETQCEFECAADVTTAIDGSQLVVKLRKR